MIVSTSKRQQANTYIVQRQDASTKSFHGRRSIFCTTSMGGMLMIGLSRCYLAAPVQHEQRCICMRIAAATTHVGSLQLSQEADSSGVVLVHFPSIIGDKV